MATDQFMSRVKWTFAGVILGVFVLFVGSSIILDDTIYANENYLFAKIETAWYHLKYSFISAPNVLAGVDNIFNDPEHYAPQETRAYAIPVLNYHGIVDTWDGSEQNISEDNFEAHMFALKEAGYKTVMLEELYQFIRGEIELPARSVVITFDDGRRDSLYGADPILRAMNFSAAMFVISKFSTGEEGGGYYLSEAELKRAQDSGVWEIQAHAHEGHADEFPIGPSGETGNFYSNKLWLTEEERLETDREYLDRTATDLVRVKRVLEEALENPVIGFAFPFGEYGQVVSNAPEIMPRMISVAENTYQMLFYQQSPGIRFRQVYAAPHQEDRSFLVRRISIHGDMPKEELLSIIEKSRPKNLPYEDVFREDRGWIPTWGTVTLNEDRGLELVAAENELGASTVLDGTGHWQNYTVTALTESPTGSGAFVWVRFADDNNNAACNFGRDFVHIEQTVAGEHRVIKGIRDGRSIPEGSFTVEVRVNGRNIECLLNGELVVSSQFLSPELTRGGIGFKKWENGVGESSLMVKRLEVTPLP